MRGAGSKCHRRGIDQHTKKHVPFGSLKKQFNVVPGQNQDEDQAIKATEPLAQTPIIVSSTELKLEKLIGGISEFKIQV